MSNNKNIDISSILIDHGIKPSYQRIKVFQYLVEQKNHPTVDKIYSELIHDIPTLSKTTVYNTLRLFASVDLVNCLTINGDEIRYDADLHKHGHFICEKCCSIYDFDINIESVNYEGLNQFQIKHKDVFYRGICKLCS